MAITTMTTEPANGKDIVTVKGGDREYNLKTTFEGCVLDLRERNGYDDSDFDALVWDDEKGCARWVQYASTRYWSYNDNAIVDATDEVRAKYNMWRNAKNAERKAEATKMQEADPTVGKTVVVVTGKKHLGKTGEIFWRGANQFRTYYKNGYSKPSDTCNQRVGIKTATGEKFFTALDQVRVIGYENVSPSEVNAHRKVAGMVAAYAPY